MSERYPYVEIIWLDAGSPGGGWRRRTDDLVKTPKVITRGWVVKRDKYQVWLTMSIPIDENQMDAEFSEDLVLPQGMIVSEQQIKFED